FKFPSGTGGKGVMYAESYPAASSLMDALETLKQPFLIQEYIETEGEDIRILVVGDRVVAAMKRKAVLGEKRANVHAGGEGEAFEPDVQMKKLAVEAAKSIGAEICAVDMLESIKGPMVVEINLSPGLQGITKVTKVDVADKIAKYLAERAKAFKEKGSKKGAVEIIKEINIDKQANEQQIITNMDFRGERILLPKLVTDLSKFTEEDEIILKVKKGKIEIEKA
ncbi:MAG: ATP-grasp domain-containing protein, partial [Nanoarchaeota archaeon]|nr:ATP-grasp domain-containing protein [Nanoarchaeota archaeon]